MNLQHRRICQPSHSADHKVVQAGKYLLLLRCQSSLAFEFRQIWSGTIGASTPILSLIGLSIRTSDDEVLEDRKIDDLPELEDPWFNRGGCGTCILHHWEVVPQVGAVQLLPPITVLVLLNQNEAYSEKTSRITHHSALNPRVSPSAVWPYCKDAGNAKKFSCRSEVNLSIDLEFSAGPQRESKAGSLERVVETQR